MPVRSPLVAVAALVALLAAPTPGVADEAPEVPLPTVTWCRTPRLLNLRVVPAEGTHLAPDLPLRAAIAGGMFTVIERNARVPEAGPTKLAVPILPGEAPDGWRLTLDGGVCSDGGDLCVPFHVAGPVPRGGAARGTLTAAPGRGPADAFGPQEPPPESPHRPPDRPALRWFDAATPGDVDAAFADAAARDTAVLADFFAVWCPPCDVLRDEFLRAPRHHDLLARFTLLRLDADAPASFPVKDRYRVGGYPTVLLLAPDGALLERIVGYPGEGEMAARLQTRSDVVSTSELRTRLNAAGDAEKRDAALALVRRLAAEGDHEAAYGVLRDAVGDPAAATDPDVLEQAAGLAAELNLPEAVDLALAGAELPLPLDRRVLAARAAGRALESANRGLDADAYLDEQRPGLLAALREELPATVAWTSDGSGADVARPLAGGPADQWRLADAAYYLGVWPGAPEAEAKELFAVAASSLTLGILQAAGESPVGDGDTTIALRPTIGPVTAGQMQLLRAHEGRYHDLVTVLIKAGLHDVAEDYLRRLVATFPDVFTWHYRHARFLLDHRSAEEALVAADLALLHGHGDNALRAATRKARILADLGRIEEAVAVVDAALAPAPPAEENVRTHRYRGALEVLRAGLLEK